MKPLGSLIYNHRLKKEMSDKFNEKKNLQRDNSVGDLKFGLKLNLLMSVRIYFSTDKK